MSYLRDKLTICVITHATKTETRGQYAGFENKVPSAPSSKLIEYVLNDLFNKTDLPNDIEIIVGLDNRIDRAVDIEYGQNLEKLKERYPGLRVKYNNSTSHDPIVTATKNFVGAIGDVQTPYYLLWEHDWVFNRPVEMEPLVRSMEKHDTFYVRFNQHRNMVASNVCESVFVPSDKSDVPILGVNHMGNNPYVCKTEVFNKWWKHLLYETPEQGGFVEGPINIFYKFAIEKMGFSKAMEQWGIHVYGNHNDEAYIKHLNGNAVNFR